MRSLINVPAAEMTSAELAGELGECQRQIAERWADDLAGHHRWLGNLLRAAALAV